MSGSARAGGRTSLEGNCRDWIGTALQLALELARANGNALVVDNACVTMATLWDQFDGGHVVPLVGSNVWDQVRWGFPEPADEYCAAWHMESWIS